MKPIEINDKKPGPLNGPEPKLSHIQLFRRLASQPDNERPLEKALLILCTPRCGSTFFSESLNSCGKLGFCDEWFNYDYFSAWEKVTGNDFDLKQYIDWIGKKTLRNTGVLTLKLHVGQLIAMNQDHNIGIESMDFTHVVHMYREDKIAQAVSLVKAMSMAQFRSTEIPAGECQITRQGIAEGLNNIVKFEQFLKSYLKQYVDASFSYEDFWVDTADHCNEVLEALGKSPCEPEAFTTIKIKKQADKRNYDAADDFRKYILGEIE